MDQRKLRKSIEQELHGNLLPFWRERSLDHVRGGFIAEMANDGTVRDDAAKGLVLNARLLWTFAALYRELGDERDLELARRAYEYLEAKFRDRDHGGYVWRVDPEGQRWTATKKVYGQAFCIYALSEYHRAKESRSACVPPPRRATGRTARPRPAVRRVHRVAGADWSATTDLRLSDGDMNAGQVDEHPPSPPGGVHQPVRRWPNPVVRRALRELFRLFDERMLTPERPLRPLLR